MNFTTITVFLIFFQFVIPQGVPDDSEGIICPTIDTAPKTLAEVEKLKMEAAINALSKQMPDLTCLGEKYMDIMKSMLSCNNTEHVFMASMSAMWQSAFQPYLSQKPDACGLAEIINATVACYKYHDKEPMIKALETMVTVMDFTIEVMVQSSIAASGCTSDYISPVKTSELPKGSCYKDGYAYDIKDMWRLRGGYLPNALEHVVLKMYKSEAFSDNFLAIIATNSLLSIIAPSKYENISMQSIAQLTSLQLASKIPKCCCKDYLRQIQEVSKGTKYIASSLMKNELQIFANEFACSPKRSHPRN